TGLTCATNCRSRSKTLTYPIRSRKQNSDQYLMSQWQGVGISQRCVLINNSHPWPSGGQVAATLWGGNPSGSTPLLHTTLQRLTFLVQLTQGCGEAFYPLIGFVRQPADIRGQGG